MKRTDKSPIGVLHTPTMTYQCLWPVQGCMKYRSFSGSFNWSFYRDCTLKHGSGGPRILVEGGAKIFLRQFPDVVKRSHTNEMSFNRPGSRAHLRALEALGFFFAEYAFSLYPFVIFLKYLNTNLCWYNCANRKNFS